VIDKPDIFEFDYKGFFDSVEISRVFFYLERQLKLPYRWGSRLRSMATSIPDFPDPVREMADESDRLAAQGPQYAAYLKRHGFPQGSPTSPLLSVLPLM